MVLAMLPKGSWFNAHNRVVALSFSLAALASAQHSRAHFKLDAPDSWAEQNSSGGPQKSGPCGERDSGTTDTAKPTNKVTAFKPGDTVTIKLTETVYHPGHYRVALAKTRSELPADPPVTKVGNDDCGSTEIDATPEFPVLADGALKHNQSFGSQQQTITVTLPTNITCEKCTLQVIQYMSSHGLNNPGGCFYHHCADISISGANSSGGGGAGGNSSGGGTALGGATSSGGAASGGASSGGSTSSGGTTQSSGGASSSAGSGLGGVPGNGGAPGSGGSTVIAAGGATATQGGSAANTQGGAVNNPPVAPAQDDGGCSFSGRSQRSGVALLALVGLSAFGFVRRRRSPNRSR